MDNHKITYHEIMDNENIYTINFPRKFDLRFSKETELIEHNEICTTINPLGGEKITAKNLNNFLKKNMPKLIKYKKIIRIHINGDGHENDCIIQENALNAENFKVLINFLKDRDCKAIYIENITCCGAYKLFDYKDVKNRDVGKNILDIVEEAGLKQDIYYGSLKPTEQFVAEPSIIECYKFNEKEKKLTLQKTYNICNNQDITNPIFNDQQLEEFFKDIKRSIYKPFTELADMSEKQRTRYMKLMECIQEDNEEPDEANKKQDKATKATIDLLDLIGKNLKDKNNNSASNKPKCNSKEKIK